MSAKPECDYCEKEAVSAIKYHGKTYLVCAEDFTQPMMITDAEEEALFKGFKDAVAKAEASNLRIQK